MPTDRSEHISCADVVAWLRAEVRAVTPGRYSPQLLGFAQQLGNLAQEWVRRLALAGENSSQSSMFTMWCSQMEKLASVNASD